MPLSTGRIELIKNQNVTIKHLSGGSLAVISNQSQGTPGIVLSKSIPLQKDQRYSVVVVSKNRDSESRIMLWVGNKQNNTLVDLKYLENGTNKHYVTVKESLNARIGVFFEQPRQGASFVIETLMFNNEPSSVASSLSSDEPLTTCHYFPPSPKSKLKLDYYVSDDDIRDQLKRLGREK